MQYIEKFTITNQLSILIHHNDENEIKTVLVKKRVHGKIKIPYKEVFDNKIKKIEFNKEYLAFSDRNFTLKDTNIKIIALKTGEEVKENKMEIYNAVSKVNKYVTFEMIGFPKKG